MKDPVCDLVVDPHDIEVIYLNRHFAFCSEQCMERFIINPQSYITKTNTNSLKSQGVQSIRERRWFLDDASSVQHQPEMIKNTLEAIVGVQWAQVAGNLLTIRYDLLQVTGKQIEKELTRCGLQLSRDPFDRMRRSYMHYLEEWELFSDEVDHNNKSNEEQA